MYLFGHVDVVVGVGGKWMYLNPHQQKIFILRPDLFLYKREVSINCLKQKSLRLMAIVDVVVTRVFL